MAQTRPHPVNIHPRPCLVCEEPCPTEGQLCPACAEAGHRVTDNAVIFNFEIRTSDGRQR